MSRTALILAAHGSRRDPTANDIVRRHADRVSALCFADVVAVAFRLASPTFATVLDAVGANDITVVPVMTSNGYYCDEVLPRELRRNRRYQRVRVRVTQPVGTHPDMRTLICRRVAGILRLFDLAPTETTLVVVGHGTERHKHSRSTTVELAADLLNSHACAQVLPAFLEEQPLVENIYHRVTWPNVVVLPFLIGGGDHATRDIPIRLGATNGLAPPTPFVSRVGSRTVVCDSAVGAHTGIVDIIAKLAAPCAHPSLTRDHLEAVR